MRDLTQARSLSSYLLDASSCLLFKLACWSIQFKAGPFAPPLFLIDPHQDLLKFNWHYMMADTDTDFQVFEDGFTQLSSDDENPKEPYLFK